jgi:hypothetical protein
MRDGSDGPGAGPEAEMESWWEKGIPWSRYLETEVRKHRDLWIGVWERARVPRWAVERLAELEGPLRLLILAEDWCGDASNTVPVLARVAEATPGMPEARILKRDEHPDLMDRYLTNGSRSIPIAIVLGPAGGEVARWGPRPRELQEHVLREKREGRLARDDIYRETRRWYARDRGETTVRELLAAIEAGLAVGGVR